MQLDRSILEMALIGYEAERRKILEKIAELQRRLGRRSIRVPAPAVDGATPGPKRQMSVAGRMRIAAAQRKRWKEFHSQQKADK
jgi:hypothetical protein